MTRLFGSLALGIAILSLSASHAAAEYTPKHEAGRCAIRGQCGTKSWFGKQLPCPDNDLATEPDEELRAALLDVCGPKWSSGPVCCEAAQVKALKSELSTANQIISSCPACKENFYNLFCTFTCSPDQSLFINVTNTMEKSGKAMVVELDQLVSEEYGSGFYDSCKDVKFGPSNSNAMSFIGGGAKNYTDFLKFLGDEKAIGSPFQINFPRSYNEPKMEPLGEMDPKACADPDYRCACVDCPAVCPELPKVKQSGWCKVGVLPCLSFAAIFVYSILVFTLVVGIIGHVWWKSHSRRRTERLRLLQDASPADDDDEGDLTHNTAMLDHPVKYYRLNNMCDKAFAGLGHFAARFPGLTITLSLIVVAVLSVGWVRFDIEKDPARLWVSPTSAAAQEKQFFDENFGPFYRAEKIFLVNETGPVLSYDAILWLIDVEASVERLKGPKFGATLHDVCLKPTGSACVVQSVAAYYSNEPSLVDPQTWEDQLRQCAASPVECRPEYGQPIEPNMILGGYQEDPATAKAITVTWVVNNFQENTPEVARAMDWEEALKFRLLDLQDEAANRGLRLSFSTEISLEEELNKSTNTDAKIIVISYVIMFMYASIALGSTTLSVREFMRNPAVTFVQSKFTLGIVGILIVLMSISASIGLFSWSGIKATLIIAEVIPFIVLAVGVDNIFLIVHEFERVNQSFPDEIVEARISKALGRMGPSILLSATTETVCFAMGAFVGMPAVRNFAVYAAGAVFINAMLQVTMFISVLTLNQMRVEDHRADCCPFIQVKAARIHLNGSSGGSGYYEAPEESLLEQFIRKSYAPVLLGKKVKTVVVVFFLGLFTAGVALIPEVQLGLDQRVAIPDGSYLIPYFNDLYDYFDSGPPLYFVAKDVGTMRNDQIEMCARFTTCDSFSLTNILEGERKRSEISYVDSPTASWIDDYFKWLDPELESCCVDGRTPCFEGRDPAWNITLSGMPEGQEFIEYLHRFLQSPTNEDCPLGGRASYSNSVVMDDKAQTIPASHFRTSHSPLRSQEDFINAYASARRISKDITENTGIEVFPYSVFYIFFDQYASIVSLTATLLCSAVAIIFVVSSILLGSVMTGAVVAGTVVMTVVDIMGAMALFSVSLNAVSLVNLIICVGIGVEFCAHIARAFMFPSRVVMERAKSRFRGKDARAWTALVNVGGSVFSGITLTKLLGVCVLAFTRSKIFEIYYFRIWLALVVLAAMHALVFLPVALSLLGGEGFVDPECEGGLESDLAARRYRGVMGDDEDSDDDY
ncbi:putative patched sphingolipid transporter protein [Zalerion maritima]|uniref:Patched sphingolipid transporter protein n=1 Tax=Zalerion maritima TaxID=339359 RepID=A0AAD5WN64_9PEZI|nr:putative patched sphingolipid transporter protein [Zalerion maritima]